MVVQELVDRFQLVPHPEGGYYRETYRAAEAIDAAHLPARFAGSRSFSSAIYFLLEAGNFSAFHRIKSDECWHFYAGDPLEVHMIAPNGHWQTVLIGGMDTPGAVYQYVVPAGYWFASQTSGTYSLVGCTVAPAFDFADFELAIASELIALFPEHAEKILPLCRQ